MAKRYGVCKKNQERGTIIPVGILFVFGQRYFVEGIATSGVKG